MQKKFFPISLALILTGIIMGFIISGAFDITSKGVAEAIPEITIDTDSEASPQIQKSDYPLIDQLSDAFNNVAEKVTPSVVTVYTEQTVKTRRHPYYNFEDFFGLPNPNQRKEREQKQQGLGSGIIVSKDGYILTNNHVVAGADEVKVRLSNNKEYKAEIIGADKKSDIAVIKIEIDNLTPLPFSNSDNAKTGQWVLAVGSPLSDQLQNTVTAGIISATGRNNVSLTGYGDYIQTDAAINKGNSGGPLVNLHGELVGINTAILSQTGGYQGIGMAVPANIAKKVMNDLIDFGKVKRGFLGVYIGDVTSEFAEAYDLEDASGAVITQVHDNSPAENAGVQNDDIVIAVDGDKIENSTDLTTKIGMKQPGTKVKLTIIRDGKKKQINVKLGEFEEEQEISAKSSESESVKKMGLTANNISPELKNKYKIPGNIDGVVITSVEPGSVLHRFGIKAGDIIDKINRKRIKNTDDYKEAIDAINEGGAVVLFLNRGERRFTISFEMPE